MNPPERIKPTSLGDYLEVMTRAMFQAGLRWSMIDAKWPDFQRVFCNFDAQKVSKFTEKDVDRLASDQSILRSQKKIEATVENAKVLIALEKEHGGFANYLQSFKSYEELTADLKKRFKYMGALNAYYFLFRVGEPVPKFEEWVETIPGEHPRMQEMVEHARAQGKA